MTGVTDLVLSPLKAKLIAGIGLAGMLTILVLLGVVFRLDHLRVTYKDQLDRSVASAEAALGEGAKVRRQDLPTAINLIATARDQFKRERDNARATVESQTESIKKLTTEGERLAAASASDRKLAEAMTAERNQWIAKAQQVETRTQRMTADKELEQCNAVLDRLFDRGF